MKLYNYALNKLLYPGGGHFIQIKSGAGEGEDREKADGEGGSSTCSPQRWFRSER